MKTTLLGVLLMIASVCFGQEQHARPVVGAIRWDAWTGGDVTTQVERTLSPAKYHSRLPWFAEVIADDKARIDGSRQEIMDREIAYAADAGLDYWAFVMYDESSTMSVALKQYLASPVRERIHFSMILHNSLGVSAEAWPKERDRAVALMKEPGYQTVLGGRPLVFAFATGADGAFPVDRFTSLRGAAREAGLNPYYVFMGWNPGRDYQSQSGAGFDAVSAYAYGGAQPSYAELTQAVESAYWDNAVKANVPYVPMVTTGWEKNPRKDNPVSWEKEQDYHKQNVFPSIATPGEIASHLKRALTFTREHPGICAAKAVIIYAWNEYDEGGWLAPTWSGTGKPDAGRLDAIKEILK